MRAAARQIALRITRKGAAKAKAATGTKDMSRGRPRAETRTVDADWFKSRLQKAKLSQRGLAALLTRDVAILNRTLLGTREATAGEVARIAEILGVETDEILRRLGYEVKPRGVVLSGALRADGRITTITARAGQYLNLASVSGADIRALIAETKGGPLEPYDGAVIVYQESAARTVPPDAIGRLCVVESAEEVVPLLGTLSRADRRGAVKFSPFGGGETRDLTGIVRASVVLRIILPQ